MAADIMKGAATGSSHYLSSQHDENSAPIALIAETPAQEWNRLGAEL